MNDVRFPEPVVLNSTRGFQRKVASSFEALECLDQEWPEWARGRSWRAACRACRDALEGWRGARDARRAFVKAAERAGLAASGQPRFRPWKRTADLRPPRGATQQPFSGMTPSTAPSAFSRQASSRSTLGWPQ
jgi:hypothetical protein